MQHLFFSLSAKLGLIAASTAIGMAAFLFFHGPEPIQAQANPRVEIRTADYWQEKVSIDLQPRLLASAKSPVDLSGDAIDVLYVLQQDGEIIRIAPGTSTLSVSTRYARLGDDQTHPQLGFSAIAFHPDFLVEESFGFGRFYVAVAEKPGVALPDFVPEFGGREVHHQDVIYEYQAHSPLAANFKGTRREVMRFNQPGPDHNLNSLTFDHRGYLYLAVGDGAASKPSRDSSSKNASSLTSAFGKVLRIDPLGRNSRNGKYGIPETNPFSLVTQALPELWAFGLRAPHSLSFDPYEQALYIGESSIGGQDRVNVSQFGGEHYGWDLDQGSFLTNFSLRKELEAIVTHPLFSVDRSAGWIGPNSGSVIYRGESFPSLAGKLIYASEDGQLVVHGANKPGEVNSPADPVALDLGPIARKEIRALRTTPRGELVLLCRDGSIVELAKGQTPGLEKSASKSLYCLVPATLPTAPTSRG